MAFTSGTATHQNDLLDKLKVYVTGLGSPWTLNHYTASAVATGTARLHIRGPGAGSGKETYINIQTRNDVPSGSYAWAVSGSTSYTSGPPSWGAQPNEGGETMFNLWQNSIPYRFYVNDRRIIVVAQVSGADILLYAGFHLPFALPGEYPFPLYVAGNAPALAPYSAADTVNRFFIDPGNGAARYRTRGSGAWKDVKNQFNGAGNPNFNYAGGSSPVMWPHRVPRAFASTLTDWNGAGISRLRPNANGEMPHWPVHIIDPESQEMAGALDGVYATPGFGRSTGQTYTIGGVTYRVFQNIGRATERDFMAIAEV